MMIYVGVKIPTCMEALCMKNESLWVSLFGVNDFMVV
jgi:hypothetical protein